MEYHELGEIFEHDGVLLEVVRSPTTNWIDMCRRCYFCNTCTYEDINCTRSTRNDNRDIVFNRIESSDIREIREKAIFGSIDTFFTDRELKILKMIDKQKETKDMKQKTEIKVEGTNKTLATQETNSLKIEDLKNGDFVAFDYNGNTAVTRLTSDDGDFMYAVGLWHDSNFVGDVDAIWYADNLKDVNSVSPITNLHYATADEIKRWANVLTESFERSEQMQRESEPKMLPDCVTTEDYIKSLTHNLALTLQAKNADYGSSFAEMFDELGIDYAYGKLREKMNRIKVLRKQSNMVENEGLEDTLLDTAGYAILTLVELKKRKDNDTH